MREYALRELLAKLELACLSVAPVGDPLPLGGANHEADTLGL